MKDELCRAFCGELSVREVPDGLAVRTAFQREGGDAVGFYIVRDKVNKNLYRIEDDGSTIPLLEGCGVDFSTDTRASAFRQLLTEYGAQYDEAESVIHSPLLAESDLPKAAMKFVALLLRTSDFLLLTQERIARTFQEDAAKLLRKKIGDKAQIIEHQPVSKELAEITPDWVITAPERTPVALFFGTSPQRVNDAIFLHMAALYEAQTEVSVIALLETDSSISRDLLRRAVNRLAGVPFFKDDEDAAVDRIAREVLGSRALLH